MPMKVMGPDCLLFRHLLGSWINKKLFFFLLKKKKHLKCELLGMKRWNNKMLLFSLLHKQNFQTSFFINSICHSFNAQLRKKNKHKLLLGQHILDFQFSLMASKSPLMWTPKKEFSSSEMYFKTLKPWELQDWIFSAAALEKKMCIKRWSLKVKF